jgi:hypothetical protein
MHDKSESVPSGGAQMHMSLHTRPAVNNRLGATQLVQKRQASSGKPFLKITAMAASCKTNCQGWRIWIYAKIIAGDVSINLWLYP